MISLAVNTFYCSLQFFKMCLVTMYSRRACSSSDTCVEYKILFYITTNDLKLHRVLLRSGQAILLDVVSVFLAVFKKQTSCVLCFSVS